MIGAWVPRMDWTLSVWPGGGGAVAVWRSRQLSGSLRTETSEDLGLKYGVRRITKHALALPRNDEQRLLYTHVHMIHLDVFLSHAFIDGPFHP